MENFLRARKTEVCRFEGLEAHSVFESVLVLMGYHLPP